MAPALPPSPSLPSVLALLMPAPGRPAPPRSLCIAFAIAALVICFSNSRAQASCGDWLEGHAMTAHGAASAAGDGTTPAAAQHSSPLRRPCSGPTCGKAPALPIAPSDAPTVPPDSDRDVAILADAALPSPGLARALCGDEPALSSSLADRLERPPKIA